MSQISIIVPVYKVEKYLSCCIDSILLQTFCDFDLILVDDGSPDRCPQICDEYAAKDSRIVVIHQENVGVAAARNTGIDWAVANSNSKWIAFIDSDDSWEEDMLQDNLKELGRSDTDMIVFNYENVTGEPQDGIMGKSSFLSGRYEINTEEARLAYLTDNFFRYKHGYEAWTKIFRKDIIAENRIRFPLSCNNYAEDMGFVAKYVLHANSILCTKESYYKRLVREDSMMQRNKNIVKMNELNEVSYDFYNEYMQTIKNENLLRNFPVFHFMIMYNQYSRLISWGSLNELGRRILDVNRSKWFKEQTRKIDKCRDYLIERFGKNATKRIIILSHYCIHRNWILFRIEHFTALHLMH